MVGLFNLPVKEGNYEYTNIKSNHKARKPAVRTYNSQKRLFGINLITFIF